MYIKPSREYELQSDQVPKLSKTLYGLADSGDYWISILRNQLVNGLGIESSINDAAIFFKKEVEELSGLCATYVYDALHTGNQEFSGLS